MSGFTLDLPDLEEIKKKTKQELAPAEEEKAAITRGVKEKADQIMAVLAGEEEDESEEETW